MCVCVFDVDVRVQSGDVKLLCELYVECGKWQEAFKVADSSPELLKMVHAQHAAHLVHHDRFEDAMQVLHLSSVHACQTAPSAPSALLFSSPKPSPSSRCRNPHTPYRLSWSLVSLKTPHACSRSFLSVPCWNRSEAPAAVVGIDVTRRPALRRCLPLQLPSLSLRAGGWCYDRTGNAQTEP